jgi:ABC-2 type transport system permease protein
VEYLPVSAVGSLIGILVILLLLTALFYAISRDRRMAAVLLAGGSVLLVGWYFLDTRRFAGMLPDALKLFSLHAAFRTAASEHILDIRGVLLYLTVIVMAIMLTVTAIRSRRWN